VALFGVDVRRGTGEVTVKEAEKGCLSSLVKAHACNSNSNCNNKNNNNNNNNNNSNNNNNNKIIDNGKPFFVNQSLKIQNLFGKKKGTGGIVEQWMNTKNSRPMYLFGQLLFGHEPWGPLHVVTGRGICAAPEACSVP
jgi:hypothetical protein